MGNKYIFICGLNQSRAEVSRKFVLSWSVLHWTISLQIIFIRKYLSTHEIKQKTDSLENDQSRYSMNILQKLTRKIISILFYVYDKNTVRSGYLKIIMKEYRRIPSKAYKPLNSIPTGVSKLTHIDRNPFKMQKKWTKDYKFNIER